MARSAIKVEGVKELKRALRQVEGGMDNLKGVHAAAAAIVETQAKSIVPRRSGVLAGSVRSTGTNSGGVVRAGFASVPYAGPIHFGWAKRNISPQPFLYDAADQRTPQVLEAFDKGVAKIIKEAGL